MRIIKFIIKNFKGIEYAKIDFIPSGANIFTLIGLNESGKTTILEAISSFNIKKDETGALYGVNSNDVKPTSYVPKRLKSNFTGDIIVEAHVEFEEGEKQAMVDEMKKLNGSKIVYESIPDIVEITRGFKFENSDFVKKIYRFSFPIEAIPAGKKKAIRQSAKDDLWQKATDYIANKLPEIIYFPTFIFNQPAKIILNPIKAEETVNKLYRQIIENIAASLERPLEVKKHIVNRILSEDSTLQKISSFLLLSPDKLQQIEAALNEMSSHVTSTVFLSWTKIFGGDFSGREIVLKPGIQTTDGEQEVYIQFAIKDRKSTYDITERSLGFRWFFSFLLFTVYKTSSTDRPILFLLDEPASNLHARAQMQLLDNLSKIAINGNQIMYSTHSHYLINPEWLDQSYIISNKAIDYEHLDGSKDINSDGQTLISIEKYRTFVGKNPDKITYFQPVLDKLDVIPSKLDFTKPSILVEGKGDYLILEYGRKITLKSKSDICIVPTRGATGMDELIGLFMGWGIPFLIILDDDKEGKLAQRKYIKEWGLQESKVWTLANIDKSLENKEISGFLNDSDIELIKNHYKITERPTKSQIQLFFSEHLAKRKQLDMSSAFTEKIKALELFIEKSFR